MGRIKAILRNLLRFKSAEERAREYLEEFQTKKHELELSVNAHLQIMQSFPDVRQDLCSLNKISSVLIFKKLEKPLFYKITALNYFREVLPSDDIKEEQINLMFLKERSGFEAIPHNLVWVYNGYFVSVGMCSYIGYIAEIEKTTRVHESRVGCLTLSTQIEGNVFKNVVLYFNVLNVNPEKICLEIFDCEECVFQSELIKEYAERPKENRLIKDCRYYQKYFL